MSKVDEVLNMKVNSNNFDEFKTKLKKAWAVEKGKLTKISNNLEKLVVETKANLKVCECCDTPLVGDIVETVKIPSDNPTKEPMMVCLHCLEKKKKAIA